MTIRVCSPPALANVYGLWHVVITLASKSQFQKNYVMFYFWMFFILNFLFIFRFLQPNNTQYRENIFNSLINITKNMTELIEVGFIQLNLMYKCILCFLCIAWNFFVYRLIQVFSTFQALSPLVHWNMVTPPILSPLYVVNQALTTLLTSTDQVLSYCT